MNAADAAMHGPGSRSAVYKCNRSRRTLSTLRNAGVEQLDVFDLGGETVREFRGIRGLQLTGDDASADVFVGKSFFNICYNQQRYVYMSLRYSYALLISPRGRVILWRTSDDHKLKVIYKNPLVLASIFV